MGLVPGLSKHSFGVLLAWVCPISLICLQKRLIGSDVCGGLISSDRTLIHPDQWASKLDLTEDVILFRAIQSFDMYANYIIYLCGRALDLLARSIKGNDAQAHLYAERWVELFDVLESWYSDRPEEMKPILLFSASSVDSSKPFPTILFGNAPASEFHDIICSAMVNLPVSVSGNQMYHTTSVLMLQARPPGVRCRKKPVSGFVDP